MPIDCMEEYHKQYNMIYSTYDTVSNPSADDATLDKFVFREEYKQLQEKLLKREETIKELEMELALYRTKIENKIYI